MAFALNRYAAGDITYISKHNSDAAILEAAINALLTATSLGIGGTSTNNWNDIWDRSGLVGASAFRVTCATSLTLSVTSGSVWILPLQARGRAITDVTLNFAARTSGIYAILADGAGGLSVSALSVAAPGSALQIYSVEFKAPDFGSAARLVDILLHGDDYNRMLSSTTLGSFTRVADRLSAIEGGAAINVYYAHSGFISGIIWSYKAGQIRNNNQIISTTASVLPLTASGTHFIEVAISTGTVSYASAGWTASEAIALYKISTIASAVCAVHDARTWAVAAGGGAGGGVAGLANSGTTDGTWYLYRGTGATSALPSTATIVIDRGSLTDVAIRYHPSIASAGTAGAWQYTDDGSTYYRFGEIAGLNPGTGQMTRLTMIASAPAVITATLSTVASPLILSLSAFVSTTTTMAILRGTAFDHAAYWFVSSDPFPGIAFYRDSATTTADGAAKIVAQVTSTLAEIPQMVFVPVSNQKIEYLAWAASDGSLQCSVYLCGYIDLTTGTGTMFLSATAATLTASVGANAYVLSQGQFSGAMNRGLVVYLETSGTIGAGSTYDVELYASNGAATSQLLMQALTIDASAAYQMRLPVAYRDLTSSKNVFLRLSNMGASAGIFSLHWQAEQYA